MSTTDWREPESGLPPGGPGTPASGRSNRIKLVILLILLAGLGWVLLLVAQYCQTHKPLGQLPVVPVAGLGGPKFAYSGSLDGVQRPLGVAVSGDGTVYVAETDGDRMIRMFDSKGRQAGAFAPPDTTIPGRVPLYIAVSPKGEIYVSDRERRTIDIFSPKGDYVGAFKPQSIAPEEWHPMGIAFDQRGNVYVTDLPENKHRVLVFDSSGALKRQFGSQGQERGQFWFPSGIAVDGQGRIYVADGDNGRLQVFDPQGNLLYVIPRGYAVGDLSLPRGVAVTKDRLFVADTSAHVVKIYDISGEEPRFLSNVGDSAGKAQFRFPNGVALAGNRIYVADRENDRVQIWSY
ncbi:MAG TPA: 6-bladed beta-propeller [Dehalococcoidia bacterium]|nr:6-bladed beta-propeller [Dehalococcoidia bacterium]